MEPEVAVEAESDGVSLPAVDGGIPGLALSLVPAALSVPAAPPALSLAAPAPPLLGAESPLAVVGPVSPLVPVSGAVADAAAGAPLDGSVDVVSELLMPEPAAESAELMLDPLVPAVVSAGVASVPAALPAVVSGGVVSVPAALPVAEELLDVVVSVPPGVPMPELEADSGGAELFGVSLVAADWSLASRSQPSTATLRSALASSALVVSENGFIADLSKLVSGSASAGAALRAAITRRSRRVGSATRCAGTRRATVACSVGTALLASGQRKSQNRDRNINRLRPFLVYGHLNSFRGVGLTDDLTRSMAPSS